MRVLDVFEKEFPDCVAVLVFDNSTIHTKAPDDALRVLLPVCNRSAATDSCRRRGT